ncbi:MAG: hypothetical protein KKD08_10310 [Alphaproteobacteria bacterium]|jgi:hypothetical protein|nr:hypothetical protein [Alphaproteobacteria bacterium]
MNPLAKFTRPPVRAIHVERFNPRSDLWQASYAGDEWTEEMLFNPPMRLPLLKAELFSCAQRRGLPIVVVTGQATSQKTECAK